MWLLTSRNRPKACQETLDAFAKYGTSLGVVWLDGDDYPNLRLPHGWEVHHGAGGISESFKWFFANLPNVPWYGWLADDMRPATGSFDQELVKTAEGKYFVYCNGGGYKTPRIAPTKPPQSIPGAMVWAGDLVRTVGWWAPTWSKYSCIDEAWKMLALTAGVARYRHDVVVEHLHWGTKLRERDDTDRVGINRAQLDFSALRDWLQSQDFKDTVERIKRFKENASPV